MIPTYQRALIVGVGDGLSASVVRTFAGDGMRVGLAARNTEKLRPLAEELNVTTHPCDVSQPDQVKELFSAMDDALGGSPDVVVYNPSARVRGPLVKLHPDGVANALAVSVYGGFLVAQAPRR